MLNPPSTPTWPDFDGRSALVTGASSGIGLAVTRQLVAAGAVVHGTSRRPVGLRTIADAGGVPHDCDLISPLARSTLVDQIGQCDLFVNAAGENRLSDLALVGEEDYRMVMAINLDAAFFITQAVAYRMRPGGSIVLVSSSAARKADPQTAAYAAAKAAILSFARSFAVDLAPRQIRVNAVAPKVIDTPMQQAHLERVSLLQGKTVDQLHRERLASIPLGRAGTADECADVILFLLSSRSSYLTGQTINVDGGWMMP